MSIQVRCRCGNKWQVDDDLDGKEIRCSSCEAPVVVAKSSHSRLYLLILVTFTLAAVAYLIFRYIEAAEERQKIYGARPQVDSVVVDSRGARGWETEPAAAPYPGGIRSF